MHFVRITYGEERGMLPLIMLQSGDNAVVKFFEENGSSFTRIRSMGIDINTPLSVVTSQADINGPVLVSVNGSRYAIDYNLAVKIMVQPL